MLTAVDAFTVLAAAWGGTGAGVGAGGSGMEAECSGTGAAASGVGAGGSGVGAAASCAMASKMTAPGASSSALTATPDSAASAGVASSSEADSYSVAMTEGVDSLATPADEPAVAASSLSALFRASSAALEPVAALASIHLLCSHLASGLGLGRLSHRRGRLLGSLVLFTLAAPLRMRWPNPPQSQHPFQPWRLVLPPQQQP